MAAPEAKPEPAGASGVAPRDPARPAPERTEPPQAAPTERPTPEGTAAAGQGAGARAAAAVAGARGEASLGALHRAVQLVTGTLEDSRAASESLARELDRVRAELAKAEAGGAAADRRAAELERELIELRAEVDAQRRALIEEQDAFLVDLLDEHERTLRSLRAELARSARPAPGGPPELPRDTATVPNFPAIPAPAPVAELERELGVAREALAKHGRERAATRELLRQLRAQRDEAQAALARALAGLRAAPTDDVDTPPAPRTATSQTPPPELLSAALVDAAWDPHPAPLPAGEPPAAPTPQPDTVRPPRASGPATGEPAARGSYSIAPAAAEEVVDLPLRPPRPPKQP